MNWIYTLPNWLFFVLCVGSTIIFAVGGLLMSRRWVRHHADKHADQNELVSYFLSAAGVIYGIALGLVAAGVWTNFQTLSAQVDEEAAIVAALYQDVGAYPQPQGAALQRELQQYVQVVIKQDWPQQRLGLLPKASGQNIQRFKQRLFDFIPTDAGLKVVHEQAITQYNDLAKVRRLRGNEDSLPPALWWVIILGSVINIVITWFFITDHLAYQLLLTLLFAMLLGSLLFLTAAMDNPFEGDFSIDASAFQEVLSQMKRGQ